MVRWKEFWRVQKQSNETELQEVSEEVNSRFKATSLNNSLKPKFGLKTGKHGSDNLKGFLTAVEKPSSRRRSNANALRSKTIKQRKYMTFSKD